MTLVRLVSMLPMRARSLPFRFEIMMTLMKLISVMTLMMIMVMVIAIKS